MIKQDILENPVNICYLAIGSNLGNKISNIKKAKTLIETFPIKIISSSSYYLTPSWPNFNDPQFTNIVIKAKTNLKINILFAILKKIEKKLGRKKSIKNSPRTCDIDIIDFKGRIIDIYVGNQRIIVPHPRMKKRNFVLFPLYEIEKNWKHPLKNTKIIDLMCNLSPKSLTTIKQI